MTRILSRPYDQHAADRLALSGFRTPYIFKSYFPVVLNLFAVIFFA